ncbi:MAG: hypothetical protein IPP63_19085 [Chloracidobacterium sp.]|nr:hypothetical protein [Chloracidobacterium sp.]
MNKAILVAFNFIGLALLLTVVSIAALSVPSPIQQIAFDQPNRAVLTFLLPLLPRSSCRSCFLPTLASLWKLFVRRTK